MAAEVVETRSQVCGVFLVEVKGLFLILHI